MLTTRFHSHDLCDCWCLPAQFCDEIVHVRNFESLMQTVGRYAPWQVVSDAAKNVLQAKRATTVLCCAFKDMKEKFLSFERPPGFTDSPSDKGCFGVEGECGALVERY